MADENTTVSSEASQGEIKRILQRFGADQIGFYEKASLYSTKKYANG